MPRSIKPMVDHLVRARRVSTTDVHTLVGAANTGAAATPRELQRLRASLERSTSKFEPPARAALEKFLEGVLGVGAMLRGWTLEAMGGMASAITGAGVIRGPVPASVTGIRAEAGIAKLDPKAGRAEVYASFKTAIGNIDGFSFLSKPPPGRTANEHTVLVKPGVNWGIAGYPTASSGESVYATTRLAFEEADRRGAQIKVVVGDQSGIENKAWGGTTLGNFERTGVLDGGIRVGLERAAAREARGEADFRGARAMLDALGDRKVKLSDKDAIAMAAKAGVTVVGFEDLPHVRVPVPGAKHFKDGILIPKMVHEDVTDIINVPKPPGRHVLMGCAGLTGALKNHIGLLGSSDRVPALHGPYDRYPGLKDTGENGDLFLDRYRHLADRVGRGEGRSVLKELQREAKWDLQSTAPGTGFHEKVVELYLAVKDKERFTVADMRRTMSSIGPDVGDTVDVGLVLAAKDPTTVDVLAASALKARYEAMGPEALLPGGDTMSEYLAGRTWLKDGASAFDLFQVRAAMAYGVAPLGREWIDLKANGSGLSERELADMTARVRTPR